MLKWYDEHDPDLDRTAKRLHIHAGTIGFTPVLAQCVSAYRRKEYAITIPALTAAVERTLRQYIPEGNYWLRISMTRLAAEQYARMQGEEAMAFFASIWASAAFFARWFYTPFGPANADAGHVFRQGVQHGTQPPPNDRVEALRLFHAWETLAFLPDGNMNS
jgi:hypothetical protein